MGPKLSNNVRVDTDLKRSSTDLSCIYRAEQSAPDSLTAACGFEQKPGNCTVGDSFDCAVLDALPQQIAVVAPDGIILAVNASWREIQQDQADPTVARGTDVGRNYLDVCRSSGGAGAEQAHMAATHIAAVLAGEAPCFSQEYACHSSSQQRWFSMMVTPLQHGRNGAVIVHTDITARRLADADLHIAAIAFESSDGMMVTDGERKILRVNQAFTSITGYGPEEAIGQLPSLLSSGHHDAAFYKAMWENIDVHGYWAGEIWNRRKNGEIYPQRLSVTSVKGPDGEISHYVASFADITISTAANDEIKYLAFYDPLTQLPNRRLLMDRLSMVLAARTRGGRYSLLMFIDLDNFKTLNDTLGHNMGDLLLQQVARRLEKCLRQSDTVARLGGDEFVVLVNELSTDETDAVRQSETLCAKILETINLPFMLGEHCFHSAASIGATLFHDRSPRQLEELLKQADIAMYQAKHGGGNSSRFFDQGMHDTAMVRARLKYRLRQALDLEQFELFYQVQVGQDGRPCGAEALLRWRQEDGSFLSPAEFIPLAEETGFILPLGQWVLKQACIQLRDWEQDPLTRELVLAINVSARQFHQADFGEQVCNTLAEHGITPTRLKLELTESVLLDHVEHAIANMQALRQSGVSFSLDDFGTGFSSLQYLKRLPLSQLKIDQSFVRELVEDANDQAIVLTIISMARSLGLDVIAEGVETEEQRLMLARLGCLHYQGYLFGRPVGATEFRRMLAVSAI